MWVRHGAWRFAQVSAAMDQIWTTEAAVLAGLVAVNLLPPDPEDDLPLIASIAR